MPKRKIKEKEEKGEEVEESDDFSFEEMGLDDRILKAISKLGWRKPTLVQEKAIRLALEGKDILARARTGSGKTGAYVIPVVQKILRSKQSSFEQCIKAVVLTPTKELCSQALRNIKEVTSSCSREVRCLDVSKQISLELQKPLLMEKPDILVSTPGRLLQHLKVENLELKNSMEMIVVDEADLLFSFGYENDMKEIIGFLPECFQAFLMSATLSEDTKALKSIILNNPVILKLEESDLPTSDKLKQFILSVDEDDKFLVMYALLKLRLLHGKIIIFVNNIDRCYRLKLFLEEFSISTCVLNSELPVASRCNIVSQFNDGRYDIIIAAEEYHLSSPQDSKTGPNSRKRFKDTESGVSRGIDFRNVTSIINFDFPKSVQSYIHRSGRTARGENRGLVLNLICPKESLHLKTVLNYFNDSHPDGFPPFKFDLEEASGLRYRAESARRLVTKDAIREARRKEIKLEMLNSEKLKTHFEDNPRDLEVLKHDKVLHTVKFQPHLKNMPDYIVPPSLKSRVINPLKRHNISNWRGKSKGKIKHQRKESDPLKSFKYSRKKTFRKKKK